MGNNLRGWIRLVTEADNGGGIFDVFHASPQHFTTFRRHTHFGSLRAAKNVLSLKQSLGGKIETIYLYHCRIHLAHPLHITYKEANNDSALFYAVRRGDYDDRYPQLRQWAANMDVQFEDLGFDGIIYPNHLDDDGSNSYVVIDPTNIQILDVHELTRTELRRFRGTIKPETV